MPTEPNASELRAMAARLLEIADAMEPPADAPLEPPWMTCARHEIGVTEIPGREHNSRVVAYHGATAAGYAPDEIPWCSSFANWCLVQAGIPGTRSKAARSWQRWGRWLDDPRLGAICVFRRGRNPAHGHVGFWAGYDAESDEIRVLGGNQGNQVCIRGYPAADLLSYRWPEGVA